MRACTLLPHTGPRLRDEKTAIQDQHSCSQHGRAWPAKSLAVLRSVGWHADIFPDLALPARCCCVCGITLCPFGCLDKALHTARATACKYIAVVSWAGCRLRSCTQNGSMGSSAIRLRPDRLAAISTTLKLYLLVTQRLCCVLLLCGVLPMCLLQGANYHLCAFV